MQVANELLPNRLSAENWPILRDLAQICALKLTVKHWSGILHEQMRRRRKIPICLRESDRGQTLAGQIISPRLDSLHGHRTNRTALKLFKGLMVIVWKSG
jgi:hypothetical protein